MKTKTEEALQKFNQGFNCAQSILTTYGEQFGLDHSTALKITTGFGAGMGRQLETCGLLTGAFMVIGMKHSMVTPDDKEEREAAITLIRKLTKEFRDTHGSPLCRDLTGYPHLDTTEEIRQFGQDPVRAGTCRACLKSVAEFLEKNIRNKPCDEGTFMAV